MIFASVDEMENELGVTFTAAQQRRALRRLEDATAAIQRFTGQTIGRVTSDSITMSGNWGPKLVLPQRPVVSVTSVTIDGDAFTNGSDYTFDGIDTLWRGSTSWIDDTVWSDTTLHWGGPQTSVAIVYTHGQDPVDNDIRGICLAAAMRGWGNPTGVAAETVMGYSVTYGQSAVSGPVVLSSAEKASLRRLRNAWSRSL